jgi:hypothetical protein
VSCACDAWELVQKWLTGFVLMQATVGLRNHLDPDNRQYGLSPCIPSLEDPGSFSQANGDVNGRFLFLGARHDIKLLPPAPLVRWLAFGNARKFRCVVESRCNGILLGKILGACWDKHLYDLY